MSKLLSLILLLAAFNLIAQPVPPPATQAEVDAGVNRFKYLTPYTFANSTLAGGPTNGVTAATATNIARYFSTNGNATMEQFPSVLSNLASTRARTNAPNHWEIYSDAGSGSTNAYYAENPALRLPLCSIVFSGLLQNVANRIGDGASI